MLSGRHTKPEPSLQISFQCKFLIKGPCCSIQRILRAGHKRRTQADIMCLCVLGINFSLDVKVLPNQSTLFSCKIKCVTFQLIRVVLLVGHVTYNAPLVCVSQTLFITLKYECLAYFILYFSISCNFDFRPWSRQIKEILLRFLKPSMSANTVHQSMSLCQIVIYGRHISAEKY